MEASEIFKVFGVCVEYTEFVYNLSVAVLVVFVFICDLFVVVLVLILFVGFAGF